MPPLTSGLTAGSVIRSILATRARRRQAGVIRPPGAHQTPPRAAFASHTSGYAYPATEAGSGPARPARAGGAQSLRASPGEPETRERLEQADLDCPIDRLAPAGYAELPVDRHDLGLHRVLRHVQPIGDLLEHQVGREHGEHPQLGWREGGWEGKGFGRPVDPPADLDQLLREHAEVGPPLEDPLGLRDGAPCTRRIGDGEIGPGDLQQRHDDGRWQRVRHQRPYKLRVDQLLAPAREVAVVDGDAGGHRVHEHGGGRRAELHPLDPAMTLARMLGCPLPVTTTHRDARPQREREERVAAAGRRRVHRLRERRVGGGRIAEHQVRLRERLERQGPPRTAAGSAATAAAAFR